MAVAEQIQLLELHAEIQRLHYENVGLRHILEASTELTFGKYIGRTYAFVMRVDPNYCKWILEQKGSFVEFTKFQSWILRNKPVPTLSRDEIKAMFH
jgi:hypothetical protein